MSSALATLNSRTFSSLRKHRNYRLFFTGQVVSLSGTWMQDTALPWLVVQHTHSPIAVGFLLFCRYIPFLLFGLFSGLVADRFDNRRFLILTQSASMTVAAALAGLTLSGVTPLAAIYALAALGGTAVVFDSPNRQTLTIQLVGRDELPNAIALNSSLFNAARVVGPAVGGVVIAAFGVGVCFAANAVSFLAVLAVLVLMRTSELFPLDRGETRRTGLDAIREGLGFVRRQPSLRLIIGLTAVIGIAGFNFRVLLPVLASDTLSVGAGGFGALFACFGAGALLGGLVAAASRRPSWKRLVVGMCGFSSALLLLGFVHLVWAAAVLLFALGLCFTLWTSVSQAILQLTTPDSLRGRVVGLYLFVFAGLTPVGSLLAGWLADVGGTKLAFSVGGGVGLVVTALVTRRLSVLRSAALRGRAEVQETPPV